MRITEGLLRRVIKSVIKESYEIEENVFKKKLNNNIEVVITNQGSDKSLPAAKRIKGVIYNSFRIETINHYVESLPPMDRIRLYGDNNRRWIVEESDGVYYLLEKIIERIRSPNNNECYTSHRFDADYFSIPDDFDPSDAANQILDQLVLKEKKMNLVDNDKLRIDWNEEYDNEYSDGIDTFTLDISYDDKVPDMYNTLMCLVEMFEGEVSLEEEERIVAEIKYKLSNGRRYMPSDIALRFTQITKDSETMEEFLIRMGFKSL